MQRDRRPSRDRPRFRHKRRLGVGLLLFALDVRRRDRRTGLRGDRLFRCRALFLLAVTAVRFGCTDRRDHHHC